MRRITFLRHGRSLADYENKFEGRYDSPLTEKTKPLHTTATTRLRFAGPSWLSLVANFGYSQNVVRNRLFFF